MTFEEYYQIMKEYGIDELCFLYADIQYYIAIDFDLAKRSHYDLLLWNDDNEKLIRFDNLEKLITTPVFNGKTLEQIWDDIEIVEIDGISESEYESLSGSYSFVEQMQEDEELQWEFFWGIKKSFFAQMKIAGLTALVFVFLSMVFPLFGLSNWAFVILTGIVSAITMVIAGVVIWKNKVEYSYHISDKKIVIYNGIVLETTYKNIRNVKLKKSMFRKSPNTIQLYVKKGWNINYTLRNIPDAEKIYNLIIENIAKTNSK